MYYVIQEILKKTINLVLWLNDIVRFSWLRGEFDVLFLWETWDELMKDTCMRILVNKVGLFDTQVPTFRVAVFDLYWCRILLSFDRVILVDVPEVNIPFRTTSKHIEHQVYTIWGASERAMWIRGTELSWSCCQCTWNKHVTWSASPKDKVPVNEGKQSGSDYRKSALRTKLYNKICVWKYMLLLLVLVILTAIPSRCPLLFSKGTPMHQV